MATAQDVARLFLTDIGAPVTAGNVKAVTVWLNAENSNPTLRNNPWNLHSAGGLPGQIGSAYVNRNDPNVAVFGTLEAGVLANARNLMGQSRYAPALSALRANNPTGFLNAIARSGWAASGYGLNHEVNGKWVPNPNGTNRLLTAYGAAQVPNPTGTTGIPTSAAGHVTTGTATLSGAGLAEYQTWLNRSLGLSDGPTRAGVGAGAGSLGDLGTFASDHPVVWVLVAAAAVALLIGRS